MAQHGFDKFEEMDKARKDLFVGYKAFGRLQDLAMNGERKIADIIYDNIISVENARVDLSKYTKQIILTELNKPNISKFDRKRFESEINRTMNIYKEVEKLCNTYINELTEMRLSYAIPSKSITLLDHLRDGSLYYSNRINEDKNRLDIMKAKSECDNKDLTPLYDKAVELSYFRENIYYEVKELFFLENEKLRCKTKTDNLNINELIEKQKSKINDYCERMQADTDEIIEQGMKKTKAKSEKFDLFYREAGKTSGMYEAVNDMFAKRILNYEKRITELKNDNDSNESKNEILDKLESLKINSVELGKNCNQIHAEIEKKIDNAALEIVSKIKSDRENKNTARSKRANYIGR